MKVAWRLSRASYLRCLRSASYFIKDSLSVRISSYFLSASALTKANSCLRSSFVCSRSYGSCSCERVSSCCCRFDLPKSFMPLARVDVRDAFLLELPGYCVYRPLWCIDEALCVCKILLSSPYISWDCLWYFVVDSSLRWWSVNLRWRAKFEPSRSGSLIIRSEKRRPLNCWSFSTNSWLAVLWDFYS